MNVFLASQGNFGSSQPHLTWHILNDFFFDSPFISGLHGVKPVGGGLGWEGWVIFIGLETFMSSYV